MHQNGIHHITAIAGSARRNLDFYTRVLGLRLVKKTVNFDDTGTYHFYYGDEAGQPGTILTFFPWERSAPGRFGVGETQEIVFRCPEGSLGYWTHRLVEKGLPTRRPRSASATPFSRSRTPTACGLRSPLSRAARTSRRGAAGEIPLGARDPRLPQREPAGGHGRPHRGDPDRHLRFHRDRSRRLGDCYKTRDTAFGGIIDLREAGNFLAGRQGTGTVHHIAFRAASDALQAEMVEKLAGNHRIRPTRPEGPKLLPVRLLPRAQWNSVRDRHR